jgi:hypothetical protein
MFSDAARREVGSMILSEAALRVIEVVSRGAIHQNRESRHSKHNGDESCVQPSCAI